MVYEKNYKSWEWDEVISLHFMLNALDVGRTDKRRMSNM